MGDEIFCGVKLVDFMNYIKQLKDRRGNKEILVELKKHLEVLESEANITSLVNGLMKQLEENKMQVILARDSKEVSDQVKKMVTTQDIVIIDDSFEILENNVFHYMIDNELNFVCTNPSISKEYKDRKRISIGNALKYDLMLNKNFVENFVKYLKDYSSIATLGIGAPDLASSDLGNLFIVDEFWGRSILCTTPRKNIFLIGVDRIVSDFLLASQIASLKGRAIDRNFNIQIHVINFPSRTGDIEKIVVYGAHGPREVTAILVDNGRIELLESGVYSIGLSILNQFLEIIYPELLYMANCLSLPSIDPLKIKLLLTNEKVKLNRDNIAVFLLLMERLLPKLEGVFWEDRLIEACKAVYKDIEREVTDVDMVQNRSQELESVVNKVWGGM